MKFKIGFDIDNGKNSEDVKDEKTFGVENSDNVENFVYMDNHSSGTVAKKSVVEVYFADRGISCSYYNDAFDLKIGHIVFVEGKLEGLPGRVTDISYSFKIKLSEYKKVIRVADTTVKGTFLLGGRCLFTKQENALPFEKIRGWFMPCTEAEEEYVTGSDDFSFPLRAPGAIKISKEVGGRGVDYFESGRVLYIELKNNHGRALIRGSRIYEVDFDYKDGEISNLNCECYCSGICKHIFSVILQLNELIFIAEDNYPDLDIMEGYLAIVNKEVFYGHALSEDKYGALILK